MVVNEPELAKRLKNLFIYCTFMSQVSMKAISI